MSKTHKTIWAAGGVLWRPRDNDGVEIGVIHRPRYDDWTLPKGKLEPDETLVMTAAREIGEETGYHVRLGRHLRDVAYDISSGHKRVRYWSAQAADGAFVENHEVDTMEWLGVEAADRLLSYSQDRRVLREFTRLPADLDTLLLVRHAKAGSRSRYRGDDRLRPLDAEGRVQADALAAMLPAFGANEVHSADRTRCEQTVAPTAEALGVPIITEPTLSEEMYRDDPVAAQRRIVALAADSGAVVRAVCSQGKVIPPLLEWWATQDGVSLPPARNRKASVWVISTHQGKLVAADHIDSPLPQHDRE